LPLYTNLNEVSYDRFNVKAANIYRVVVDDKSADGQVHKFSATGNMPGPGFKRLLPEIQDFVRIYGTSYTIKRGTGVFDQPALFVDSNFFSVFTFPLLYGNSQNALNDPHSVVLSEEIAERYFGKENPVGKTLDLKVHDQFQPFRVTAVTKTYRLQPLLAMHTTTDYPADSGLLDASDPIYSYILIGIALFILAIACVNFVNLTVARSLKRAKEIGIGEIKVGPFCQSKRL
jgi:hypothetical protein